MQIKLEEKRKTKKEKIEFSSGNVYLHKDGSILLAVGQCWGDDTFDSVLIFRPDNLYLNNWNKKYWFDKEVERGNIIEDITDKVTIKFEIGENDV